MRSAAYHGVLLSLCLGFGACVTVDVRAGAQGSVENPVVCPGPEEQRGYLKRLRPKEEPARRLDYEYEDAVLGTGTDVLDRFRVENPAPDTRTWFDVVLDPFRFEPVRPRNYRVYMSLYGSGPCENEPVVGYELLQ